MKPGMGLAIARKFDSVFTTIFRCLIDTPTKGLYSLKVG